MTGRIYTAPELAAHVAALASAFGVRLLVNPAIPPEAARAGTGRLAGAALKLVEVAPVTDETTYAVALHEVGHHIAPCGTVDLESAQGRATGEPATLADWNLLVLAEESAWEYAAYHALCWTDPMAFVKQWSLGTYYAGRAAFVAEVQARALASTPRVRAQTQASRLAAAQAFANQIFGGGLNLLARSHTR